MLSIFVTFSGISILFKLVQLENAWFPILSIVFGIITVSNFEQLLNAELPIVSTPSNISTIAKSLHP